MARTTHDYLVDRPPRSSPTDPGRSPLRPGDYHADSRTELGPIGRIDAALPYWLSCDMTSKASSVAKRFYTPQEVAELLGVSSTTVMSRIHEGALPAVRVSDRIYRVPIPAF